MSKHHDTKELSQGQWFTILTRLGIDGGLLDGKHHAFTEVGAMKDGFRFIDKQGDGHCSVGQGRFVDGFGLLKAWQGYSFKDAADAVDDVMGWGVDDYTPPTQAEREAIKAAHEEKAKQRGQALQAEYKQVSEQCTQQWGACQDVEGSKHEYLRNKGVESYGLRVDNVGNLLVPVYQDEKTISSLQTISPNGEKRFTSKGKMGGGYFCIKGKCGVIVVEGYATGASIHEATGNTVMVSFNAGNLVKVASMVRDKMHGVEIIIAADNDKKADKNTGLEAAIEAAQAVGALIALPVGKDGLNTDWNDMHASQGIEVVKAGIDNAQTPDALMTMLGLTKALPTNEEATSTDKTDKTDLIGEWDEIIPLNHADKPREFPLHECCPPTTGNYLGAYCHSHASASGSSLGCWNSGYFNSYWQKGEGENANTYGICTYMDMYCFRIGLP